MCAPKIKNTTTTVQAPAQAPLINVAPQQSPILNVGGNNDDDLLPGRGAAALGRLKLRAGAQGTSSKTGAARVGNTPGGIVPGAISPGSSSGSSSTGDSYGYADPFSGQAYVGGGFN